MSKKTRKKSPKTPPLKAVRAKSGKSAKTSTKTSAKKPSAKTSKAAAKKSGKAAGKPAGAASAKASHKAPSKPLRKTVPAASPARTVAASKAPAKPVAPASRASGLTEGAMAPAFRLPRDGGDTVSLADYRGRKLVLFFYPRADTPGCTKEAIDFTRLSSAFAEHQTAVLGVSADPLKAQEAFRDKHGLATPLVSDEQHAMLEAYGVWGEKSMYGRTFLGIVRTTVLLGADGRILKVWRNVKVDGHAEEVLAAVRAL
ncbi:peroxiredoxin [Bradyrhizobium sediminis]|uniref:thioredoxin-dependent peroxiredoxin n=1 Tax=Bradyrhizobium sediminis TaxID=2840469 RepID=A0A975NKN4_9BRAD|nr:peroxiredoxin [Bradyrhizobium sediminis]QWG15814.1 peroxiredoxin [Bradyrhizobium sediminis]